MNACSTYTLACLVSKVVQYLQIGISLIISLAVVTFIWNVYQYFFKADVENKKEAGMYVLYSTIGFFVILSFWGLVMILKNTLKLPDSTPAWPFGAGGGSTGAAAPQNMFNSSQGTPSSNGVGSYFTGPGISTGGSDGGVSTGGNSGGVSSGGNNGGVSGGGTHGPL
jgi:hypothetical protein